MAGVSRYSAEYIENAVQSICAKLAEGIPLTVICKDEALPNVDTIHHWVLENKTPTIAADIARAREIGYDTIADQARLVAQGKVGFSTGDVMRDKLIIDTDLNLLAKWSKRYANKQQVELTGKDGEPLSMRLIEAQQRLLKDITPQQKIIEHIAPLILDDLI